MVIWPLGDVWGIVILLMVTLLGGFKQETVTDLLNVPYLLT